MAPSKIRKALGAVKDKTSIGLAKVGNSASLSDLEVAIVKATRHEEYPAEERYVSEILSLTCYSRAYISACVNTLSRRLNKTKNWIVALKTLMLIQRLVSEGDPAYEQEIFFSTRRGTRFLNMSDFRDTSLSNSWDYSAFVRTYALYLDEKLEFRMQSRRGRRSAFGLDNEEGEQNNNININLYDDDDDDDDDNNNNNGNGGGNDNDNSQAIVVRIAPVREMTTEQLFSRIQHLQQLLERFLACRPTGAAKNNRVVLVALYPIVKESFQIYYDITEIMGLLIDRFMQLSIRDCVKVYEIFCRVGKQFDELELFYCWSRSTGIARSSEYPEVEKITLKKLEVMDEFIKDKSALAQSQKDRGKNERHEQITNEEEEQEQEQEPELELDMNSIKALPPPPEEFKEEEQEQEQETTIEIKEEIDEIKPKQDSLMGDLLNLGEELALTREQNANKLELALFDGSSSTTNPSSTLPWQAFNDTSSDWETTLVQSASHLTNQKADLGGGFDMLLLDGMYNKQTTMGSSGYGVSGSASSMALGSAGRPAMLALAAPPSSHGSASSSSIVSDPFAASVAVAPPSYVQMSEMERKQKLLVEEQLMWQQYARDGRQIQHNPYTGGFTRS
ncbi:putative clathrin assembly protein At1g03050 [Cucurbita pepo subsp. pepo]|uniref:putative clathrin assembly protein At1g03050 n=1 Tax=Cucurbita pepo subsp. pepo TaxID=3664 RepID=UPI000C9D8805|nr:putative clathrin assembly protein At1g03050 [Cucurbita pepo subsp. pepo]